MRTALQHGFVSYDFENGELLHSEEELLPARKRARSANANYTSVNLPANPLCTESGYREQAWSRCAVIMMSIAGCTVVLMRPAERRVPME